MKRLLIFSIPLLIIALLFVGCSNASNKDKQKVSDIPRPSFESNFLQNNTMRIIVPTIFKWGTTPTDEHLNKWENYIKDKYSINIEVIYSDRKSQDYNSTNYSDYRIVANDIKEIAGMKGFVYISSYSDLQELVQSDLIKPINEYISDASELSFLTTGLYDNFTDSDGNTWAFPLSDNTSVSSRVYNIEWLNDANIDIPESIDEFYEYAKIVATRDPDGDGLKNSYITWFNPISLAKDFADVYRAFGCYSSSYFRPIAYNPLKGIYEIPALNENFDELMEFLKKLKDERLIVNTTGIDMSDYKNKSFKIASTYSSGVINKEDEVFSFGLRGTNEKYLIPRNSLAGLAVLKDTDEVSSQINGFVNKLVLNEDIKYDMLYGILGEDYFDMGEHYEAYRDNDHSLYSSRIGISTSFNSANKDVKPLFSYKDRESAEVKREVYQQLPIKVDSSTIYDTDIFYSVPYKKTYNSEIEKLNMEINGLMGILYSEIFDNNVPINEAIEKFCEEAENLGVIAELAKINGE